MKTPSAETPLMQQYEGLKANHRNEIVFFRLGDFYEMFGEDAERAAPILEVALTHRQNVPMCGVPYHAADRYMAKLLKKGLRVAIAEQMEEAGNGKGLVKRDITRVISNGTLIEENLLTAKSNNYLAAIAFGTELVDLAADLGQLPIGNCPKSYGLAYVDISTGEFRYSQNETQGNWSGLANEINLLNPAELLLCRHSGLDRHSRESGNLVNDHSLLDSRFRGNDDQDDLPKDLKKVLDGTPYQLLNPNELEVVSLSKIFPEEGQNWGNSLLAKSAAEIILSYLQKTNPQFIKNLRPPQSVNLEEFMQLDKETLENLEILKNSLDGGTSKTLLDFLDLTLTPMGARALRQWLSRPLIHLEKIKDRLSSVHFFVQENSLRLNCRQTLKNCSDLERILIRILSSRANPHDLIHLKNSLLKIQEIKEEFGFGRPSGPNCHSGESRNLVDKLSLLDSGFRRNDEQGGNDDRGENRDSALFVGQIGRCPYFPKKLEELLQNLLDTSQITEIIRSSIVDEPPATLENGGVIRAGLDPPLDEKRKALSEGNAWLQELEQREKERTNISTLRLGYTSVFGYYLEVTKSHLSKVPPHWHRKQTLINTERYTNEELKNLEGKILGAQEQSLRLEKALYQNVLESLKKESALIQKIAQSISELDCLLSLSEVAQLRGLSLPEWGNSDEILIKEGWHPVVKESLPFGTFVPNDTKLNSTDHQIIILTGPNMAGKSTYLRQVALITFMAQVGSFVSAAEARLSLVDRIFTRIGSGDRLAQGQSTFMVEMSETSKILKQCTQNSLIILDEVGRGTSTYDGISIAWSVIEYLAKTKSKVLFATHYFELTQLSKILEKVKNYNVEAKEVKDTVLFLHKISPGPADRSYGIHVAQLAGLPAEVIERAKEILKGLELEHNTLLESKKMKHDPQIELF